MFVSQYEKLMKEWNYSKNDLIDPAKLSHGSHLNVWWKCEKGHEWKANPRNRIIGGTGCPYCANLKILKGYNDLLTVNPKLAMEWNYDKNIDISPDSIGVGYYKNVWWKCENNHEWQATVNKRNHGRNCPICSNKKILIGYNDLYTLNPEISKEWNYDKNASLSPKSFSVQSNKIVWWICEYGHEWKTSISHRTNGRNCPVCSSELRQSFPEKAIAFYCRKFVGNTLENFVYQGSSKFELDIYLPLLNVGIEYDGQFWHKKIDKDIAKNKKCSDNGITLIRVREPLCPSLNDSSLDILLNDLSLLSLESAIIEILEYIKQTFSINISAKVNISEDLIEIRKLLVYLEKENSLDSVRPDLVKEWDFEMNAPLKPTNVKVNSNKLVWWKCEKGHLWKSKINNRTSVNNNGCPFCSGLKLLVGHNDLQSQRPDLAKQWHPTKNGDLMPNNITKSTRKKVWWRCDYGHEFFTSPNERKNSNCPICYKIKFSKVRDF